MYQIIAFIIAVVAVVIIFMVVNRNGGRSLVMKNPEQYWNNKYPKANILYKGRKIPKFGMYALDVRSFCCNSNAVELQSIVKDWKGGDDDDVALKCLSWVIDNVKYESDKAQFGLPEFWMYPSETLKTRKGDCDDGAILLENLMRAAGIPYWKIRLTAGLVPEGGHAYVTYYVEKLGRWVALDWSYYPNKKHPTQRPDYKNSKIYKEVWFSWNLKYSFHKGTRATRASAEERLEVEF